VANLNRHFRVDDAVDYFEGERPPERGQ